MRELPVAQARRIALAAQGFDRPRPRRAANRAQLARAVERLGLLQIDSVNVLERAHYLPLFARLGAYDRSRLDAIVWGGGEFMEHWGHVASILPTETFPLFRHRMQQPHAGPRTRKWLRGNQAYLRRVLDHVRECGPVTAADVPEPTKAPKRREPGWWNWSSAKLALEWHLRIGNLAVVERGPDFARRFDLTERVVPACHLRTHPTREDAQRELLRRAALRHGVGTLGDLADYYRLKIPDARPRVRELVDRGELVAVRVEGSKDTWYLHPEARRPRSIRTRALLCPFDPVVWHRPRIASLFGFDYKIEIYVPAANRRYGYYVLPFLLDDALVARVDLKADRAAGVLRVQASHAEPGVDRTRVARDLAAELRDMAGWLGLGDVAVGRRGSLAQALRKACA